MSKDGRTVAIGAVGNNEKGFYSGHVRVYIWKINSWVQRGLDINGEKPEDYSGVSVSMSDDGAVVAIGAHHNSDEDSFYYAGHVRVYVWDSEKWEQRGSDINGEAEDDSSGRSVSLSNDGTVVAIGSEFNTGGSYRSGHVRVYKWDADGDKWSQRGEDIDGEAEEDNSGYSVSISHDGTVVAIGAYDNDGANSTNSGAGHVRVYEWNSEWKQRGMDIDGEAAQDRSGRSVSMSDDGTVVAIGAYGNDAKGNVSGHVRVYKWNVGTKRWIQRGADIDAENSGDMSGSSVSMSGDGTTVAIGAPKNDGNGDSSGHVRVYDWISNEWSLRGGINGDIDGENRGDRFGGAVSISHNGNKVAIGAVLNSRGPSNGTVYKYAGHVRVMEWDDCVANCADPVNRFHVTKDGKPIARVCDWVGRKSVIYRCSLPGVSEMCPFTCDTCDICTDSTLRIKLFKNGVLITKSCLWPASQSAVSRCPLIGPDACRKTCGMC